MCYIYAFENSTLRLEYSTNDHAKIAKRSLEVDKELNPEKTLKIFDIKDNVLIVTFKAIDARMLRVSLSSFFDMAMVVSRTLAEFG